jgi:hypothetical protein
MVAAAGEMMGSILAGGWAWLIPMGSGSGDLPTAWWPMISWTGWSNCLRIASSSASEMPFGAFQPPLFMQTC